MGPAKAVVFWLIAITASLFDLRHRRVPNLLILAGIIAGTAFSAIQGWPGLLRGTAGFLLGTALLFPFFLLGGVGGGDVKSLALIGLFAGPNLLIPAFMCGACLGGCVSALAVVHRRIRVSRSVPGSGSVQDRFTLPYAGVLFVAAAAFLTLRGWAA